MKTIFTAALLAALSVATVGCLSEAESAAILSGSPPALVVGTGDSRAYLNSFNLPSHRVAIEGYCPVAYFSGTPVRGKPEHASAFNGVTYYFVSAGAKKAFDANPEKYIPAYGGWCAFGMAIQDKFPIDPQKFKIVNGRLFLFLNNKNVDALELWNKGNEDEQLKKANAHWKKVQG